MENVINFEKIDGKNIYSNDDFEIEVSFFKYSAEVTALFVQFSLLVEGKFHPCEVIHPMDCNYNCNKDKKCPYEERKKKIVSCSSNYFTEKNFEKGIEKAKRWCIESCRSEKIASMLDCRWVF